MLFYHGEPEEFTLAIRQVPTKETTEVLHTEAQHT